MSEIWQVTTQLYKTMQLRVSLNVVYELFRNKNIICIEYIVLKLQELTIITEVQDLLYYSKNLINLPNEIFSNQPIYTFFIDICKLIFCNYSKVKIYIFLLLGGGKTLAAAAQMGVKAKVTAGPQPIIIRPTTNPLAGKYFNYSISLQIGKLKNKQIELNSTHI